mmetsp:Transcript_45011/g.105160  ORF Transcript_45011/g.105160 Transcript_45011/m.105160 type:complete len:290 (-) Transcript_45011:439-1308(-)
MLPPPRRRGLTGHEMRPSSRRWGTTPDARRETGDGTERGSLLVRCGSSRVLSPARAGVAGTILVRGQLKGALEKGDLGDHPSFADELDAEPDRLALQRVRQPRQEQPLGLEGRPSGMQHVAMRCEAARKDAARVRAAPHRRDQVDLVAHHVAHVAAALVEQHLEGAENRDRRRRRGEAVRGRRDVHVGAAAHQLEEPLAAAAARHARHLARHLLLERLDGEVNLGALDVRHMHNRRRHGGASDFWRGRRRLVANLHEGARPTRGAEQLVRRRSADGTDDCAIRIVDEAH